MISWKNKIRVKTEKEGFEEFINSCLLEDISLENICQCQDGFEFTVSPDGYERVRNIAHTCGMGCEVVRKLGFGNFLHRHRRRYGFYAGALLALAALCYLTSCIWVVEVIGNTETPAGEIIEVMDRYGIGVGKLRFGKKISDIKNSGLIELDSLAWMWVTLDGTKAVIEVREKGSLPEIFHSGEYCNLVAAYPGLIVDMRVRHGRKVVARGDVVSSGDLLVSGIADTGYNGIRYIHSGGEVIARTWRTAAGEFAPVKTKKIPTGKKIRKINVNIFGNEFKNILFAKNEFENSVVEKNIHQVKIFKNIYLPLTFTIEYFCEIILENESLSEQQTLKAAVASLTEEICAARSDDSVTVDTSYEYTRCSDGNLYVKVTVVSEENIAQEAKIEVDLPEESTSGEGY